MHTPGDGGEMTLAFELSALRTLAEPGTVFADARRWSTHTGVVTDEPGSVRSRYTRKRRIRADFDSMGERITTALERIKAEYDTDRYVLVSGGEADRDRVESVGWEHLPVDAAADAAGWAIGPQRKPDGEPDRREWP
ncbi:MAG: hypothetical protein ABEJ60_05585 [Halodesulfurarchaeum sp.]